MIGTYAAVLAVLAASLTIGQAAVALCGARRWSWLSPAVGLALLAATCWGTVRLPGHGIVSVLVVLALMASAILFLRGRVEGGGEALRAGLLVGLAALVAASLPFVVEGRFGILGTGFNPDMSQHLLAADRLSHGLGFQLLHQGYPLGPHSIAVALNKGLGIGLVQGFGGLTAALAVLAPLTALAAFRDTPPARRTAGALLVGLPYMVASYFAQGAFKETMQALFVLAFALSLREVSYDPGWRDLPLRFVPAAVIAIGAVYAYSFPGLVWLATTAAVWALAEIVMGKSASSAGGVGVGAPSASPEAAEGKASFLPPRCPSAGSSAQGQEGAPTPATGPAAASFGPSPARGALLALVVFLVGALPELGRMIDFHSFETFAPRGPGLGNLFGQISPLEALGIWPSGDFRLAPGDGAAPAITFWLGAAFATALLLYGLLKCWRRRETAIVAGLLAAAAVYAATRAGGTPYTAAKAIEVTAPLATLVILLPLLGSSAVEGERGLWKRRRFRGTVPTSGMSPSRRPGTAFAGRFSGVRLGPRRLPACTPGRIAAAYVLAAAGCSLLALANAPVGPTSYSPALTGLRPLLASGSTLVLAPRRLLEEEHGIPYIAWELRGHRVCIEDEGAAGGAPPPGVRFVVSGDLLEGTSEGSPRGEGRLGRIAEDPPGRPPFRDLRVRRLAGPYVLWERAGPIRGRGPCPLIAVRQARQGPGR